MQVYQLPDRAGGGSATLAISGLEEQLGELRECGINPPSPMRDDNVSVVMIKDPASAGERSVHWQR
ncbi:MAG TPA: hypothetical protein VHW95_09280 [Steroidobacteraceae bacterium]|nr:hypothetical protein [Steroidobacteraceae bacterium]